MLNQASAQRQSFLPRGIPGGGIRKPFPGEGSRPGQRPLGGGNRPLRWQVQGGAGGGSGTTAPAAIPAPNVAMPSAGMPAPPVQYPRAPNVAMPSAGMPTPGQPAPPPGSQPPKSSASPPLIPGPGMGEHAGSAPIFSQPAPPALGEYQQPTQKRAQLAALSPGQSNSNMGVGY